MVAHLQVILSSPSRAPSEWQNGRLAQCPPRRRLQLGRVGEGRPSIQEGARIKRHGKLIDASSPAPMMRSCKVSQSSHFARPGRGESSSRDGALSPASVRSKPAWSTDDIDDDGDWEVVRNTDCASVGVQIATRPILRYTRCRLGIHNLSDNNDDNNDDEIQCVPQYYHGGFPQCL